MDRGPTNHYNHDQNTKDRTNCVSTRQLPNGTSDTTSKMMNSQKSSYPRKRVSSEVVTHCNSWIPAFTGMTVNRTFQLFAKASKMVAAERAMRTILGRQ